MHDPLFRFRFLAAALLCGGLFAAHAGAGDEEGYDLRGPGPQAGETVRETLTMEMRDGTMTMSSGEHEMEGKMSMISQRETERTALEVAGDKPAKIRKRILRSTTEQVIEVRGQPQRHAEQDPLAGQTIIGERENDRWTLRLEKGEPDMLQQRALRSMAEEWDRPFNPYPERPIKVGESWEIEPEKMPRWMGTNVADAEGTMTFTLKEITEHEGERVARIETVVEVRGAANEAGGQTTVEMRLEGTILRSLEGFIDRDVNLNGEMALRGKDEQAGMELTMSGPITLRSSQQRGVPAAEDEDEDEDEDAPN